jgi:hypothetical protein
VEREDAMLRLSSDLYEWVALQLSSIQGHRVDELNVERIAGGGSFRVYYRIAAQGRT